MNPLLRKEMRLSASMLSYIFIAFAFLTMLPGYPILCGAFFITLGIFHSFQTAREANDIVFSALLPIAKKDVVKGKFQFSMMIELLGFCVMVVLTLVRMTVFADAEIYQQNALMNANLFFLGMALVAFGIFNAVFISGFFKTAYKLSSFVTYIVVVFVVIALAEATHYVPGLEALNSFGFDNMVLQVCMLLLGALLYIILTYSSYRISCARFDAIDL